MSGRFYYDSRLRTLRRIPAKPRMGYMGPMVGISDGQKKAVGKEWSEKIGER